MTDGERDGLRETVKLRLVQGEAEEELDPEGEPLKQSDAE